MFGFSGSLLKGSCLSRNLAKARNDTFLTSEGARAPRGLFITPQGAARKGKLRTKSIRKALIPRISLLTRLQVSQFSIPGAWRLVDGNMVDGHILSLPAPHPKMAIHDPIVGFESEFSNLKCLGTRPRLFNNRFCSKAFPRNIPQFRKASFTNWQLKFENSFTRQGC